MIFLVQYDRAAGPLIEPLQPFTDAEQAFDARLQAEIAHHRAGRDIEVVLLEADREEQLHMSHGRYFFTAPQLLQRLADWVRQ